MVGQNDNFLTLTFEGGRFEGHSVPVEILAELVTVQQLVEQIARALFFRRHPDRKRVPPGFPEAAQLHLMAAERNCYTAPLRQVLPIAGQFNFEPLFISARDLSIGALAAAADAQPLPESFPHEALDLVTALGKRLTDDEWLLVRGTEGTQPARVDFKTRARLAQMAQRPYERVETLEGEIEQLDDRNRRFWLRVDNGIRLEIPFEAPQRESLVEALDLRPITRVRVRGLVNDEKLKMKRVEELELVDDERALEVQRLWNRIGSLQKIQDGWLDGEGRAPTSIALSRAHEVLGRLLVRHRQLPRPKVFPRPDGGVQAEWMLGSWAIEVAFDPEDGGVEAEATQLETGRESITHFPGNSITGDHIEPLVRWLLSLV